MLLLKTLHDSYVREAILEHQGDEGVLALSVPKRREGRCEKSTPSRLIVCEEQENFPLMSPLEPEKLLLL